MSNTNTAIAKTAAQQRQRRQTNAQRYAPKPALNTPAKQVAQPKQDPRLRKILVDTLDALKRPDQAPSQVIYEALLKASQLR